MPVFRIIATCLSFQLIFCWSSAEAHQIKGRIEKIFVDGEMILEKELKAQQAIFDVRLIAEKNRPRILQAQLKSLPAILRGEWNGTLKIVENVLHPSLRERHSLNTLEAMVARVGTE